MRLSQFAGSCGCGCGSEEGGLPMPPHAVVTVGSCHEVVFRIVLT
jgi:hypothetical protein